MTDEATWAFIVRGDSSSLFIFCFFLFDETDTACMPLWLIIIYLTLDTYF